MDANTLKEFLVKIGFGVDQAGLRKLQTGLKDVTGAVTSLTKAALGMATAVTAAVTVTARSLDELYYASQRADSTAATLMSIGHAARAVGLSASAVRGQIEGLAASFRDVPAMRSWLQNITGTRGDPGQMMEGFARYYRQMQSQGREMMARMVMRAGGMDPDQIRQMAMNLPAFLKSKAEMEKWFSALGFNANQASEQAVNFMREINRSWGLFSVIWDKLTVTLLPVLQTGLRQLNDLISAHMEDIRAFIEGPVTDAVKYLVDPNTWASFRRSIDENWGPFITTIQTVGRGLGKIIEAVKYLYNHPIFFSAIVGGPIGAAARMTLIPTAEAEKSAAGHSRAEGLGLDPIPLLSTPTSTLDKFKAWLSGETHSPNVDIYEANGLWSSFKAWLAGSQALVPMVTLSDSTIEKLRLASLKIGGGAGSGNGSAPGNSKGEPYVASLDRHRMPGRFGGMGPTRAGGGDSTNASIDDPEIRAAADIIARRESNNRNVKNYMYGIKGYRNGVPIGYTASGYYQMLATNWHKYGQGVVDFSKYNEAYMAPRAIQDQVFARMYHTEGYHPWSAAAGGSISNDVAFRAELARRMAGGGGHLDAAAKAHLAQNPHFPSGLPDWYKAQFGNGYATDAHARVSNSSFQQGGDQSFTVAPTTTINVHGTADARQTAAYVTDAQHRVTAGAVRAFQPAAQ